MIHIGVYAICKNERSNVWRWVTSMWANGQGADKVYILDTGSTDDTVKAFFDTCSSLGIPSGWLAIKQKTYDAWRFDVARNDNLAMTEQDAYWLDVLVCVDLDETFTDDFWQDLRNLVSMHPDFGRIHYLYAWNHDENGDPKRVFWYDKVHPVGGCYWIHAVHEELIVGDQEWHEAYKMPEKIYLHHWPDVKKSRSAYLDLLWQRYAEEPKDINGMYYLMREILSRDYRDLQALDIANRAIIQIKGSGDDVYDCYPFFLIAMADIYAAWAMDQEAEFFYQQALVNYSYLRQPYISYGSWAAYHGKHELAMALMDRMETLITDKYATWYECDYNWTWRPIHIRAVALCWAGKYDQAQELFAQAKEHYIITQTDINEASAMGFFDDAAWLDNKLKEDK